MRWQIAQNQGPASIPEKTLGRILRRGRDMGDSRQWISTQFSSKEKRESPRRNDILQYPYLLQGFGVCVCVL